MLPSSAAFLWRRRGFRVECEWKLWIDGSGDDITDDTAHTREEGGKVQ